MHRELDMGGFMPFTIMQKAEAGGLQVQNQPGIYRKILLQQYFTLTFTPIYISA
jgi:hypothetical protein